MSSAESTSVTSVKEVDYLDEDKPIRGQNFVLLSFLSPEDVLVNKENALNYLIEVIMNSVRKSMDRMNY